MKLEQIKRSFIYRYVVYRMHQHEKKSISLRAVSNQEKEELYERVSRQVIRAVLLFAPLYFVGIFLFSHYMWLISDNNDFAAWFCNTVFFANVIIQGSWGYTWADKRGIVLQVVWRLLPVIILLGIPLVVFLVCTAELLMKRALKEHKKNSKDNETDKTITRV